LNYCILFPFINIFYLLYKLPLFEIHFHFFHICISMVYFNFKDIYHYNYVDTLPLPTLTHCLCLRWHIASAYVDTLPLPTLTHCLCLRWHIASAYVDTLPLPTLTHCLCLRWHIASAYYVSIEFWNWFCFSLY
jgi:hypothetical protein